MAGDDPVGLRDVVLTVAYVVLSPVAALGRRVRPAWHSRRDARRETYWRRPPG